MNLAYRIQTLRKQKGISQEQLANELGVSRQAVSKWESEQSFPEIDKILLMSDYFQVSTDYLLKGIESHQASDSYKFIHILSLAINAFGLMVTILLWLHYQTTLCYIPVFTCNIGSLIVYAVGLYSCPDNKKSQTRRKFWHMNIWLITLIPVIAFTDMNLFFAPHPMIWLVSLIPYLIICLSVTFLVK